MISKLSNWWNKKVSPPIRWMVYLFTAMILLSLIFAPEPNPKDFYHTDFSYQSSSKLYFHNVRSYYYYREEEEKAGFFRYELKKQRMIGSLLPFRLCLLDNWRSNEVYLLLQPDSTITHIKVDTTIFATTSLNRDKMHQMAASIYLALNEGKPIMVKTERESFAEVLTERKQTKTLETVLFDYFRWLDIH